MLDYEAYRKANVVDPMPEPRYNFTGGFNVALFYEQFEEAVRFYSQVLGPPAYVEGTGTRAWPIGAGWLTFLKGKDGNPKNIEVIFEVDSPTSAEAMQAAFIAAGGHGAAPSDQLMFVPVRYCPVRDPFDTDLLIISKLPIS